MRRKAHAAQRALVGDGSKLRVGIAVARFNEDITEALLFGARETLRAWGVKDAHVYVIRVAGSYELPLAIARLIKRHKLDAAVALGCIVKGETKHDEYLAHAVATGLMQLMLSTNVPIGFGVITANTLQQARARSRGRANKGSEAAAAALESACA